ncbi:MAG: S8 family serine peptidase [Syntrophobacterales bacterium]|nr:MAG: S8 family serine peptidase [Syntrophobacterales bacterium]
MEVQHIGLPPSVSLEDALRLYRQNPSVEYAEPNYFIYACQVFPNDPPFDPEDSNYGILWGLDNFGQTIGGRLGLPGADINAPDAWEISTGGEEVIIAVIDTGVAFSHPDLVANMWTNPGEDPWADPTDPATGNGIDDDGDGKVDDWRGWDFVEGSNDPIDYHGHGTHVGGTIAAMGDNGEGITGVMWKASIMPLRFLNTNGIGTVSDAIGAIEYAVEKGARVINASWGMNNFSEFLFDAIQFCNEEGVLVVAAAGNSDLNIDNNPFYPASYDLPNIISVAATDQRDTLASFSNWGPSTVDVAAPGVTIYSTWPSWHSVGGSFPDDIESGPGDWETGGTTPWVIVATEHRSPTHCWTDSPWGDYGNNTNSWLILPMVDLSRKRLSSLTYYLRMETEPYRDLLYVEASVDGIEWTNIYGQGVGYTGSTEGTFVNISDDISAFDGEPTVYIRFRLVTDHQNTFDGVSIDDVDITSVSHIYDGDEFQFLEGTSMAAPHVSGLAGLILAKYPTLPSDHLRWRILNGTDALEGLMGKVATGGKINANNSLRLPAAPSGLSISRVYETDVEFDWADNSADEEGFKIERREQDSEYMEIAQVGPETTGYLDTDLAGETSYTYRVRAYNSYGNSGYTNEAVTAISVGDSGLSRGGGGGGCFIATAAYGSPHGRSIDLLRAFRDEYLMAHPIGRKWVDLYYRYSPIMAGFITYRPVIRKGVRVALYPFVALSAAMTTRSNSRIILILAPILFFFSAIITIARTDKSRL